MLNTYFKSFSRTGQAAVLVVILLPKLIFAQSTPPGRMIGAAQAKADAEQKVAAGEEPTCKGLMGLPWYLPLLKQKDNNTVICFYQTSGSVAPLNQIRFLYGFGGGDSKTLSADLVSIQFPRGLQATLGSSVTMGTSTTSTSTTTITNAAGQQKQSTTTLTADSPATTISKIENGGDLYLQLDYPILYHNNKDDTLAGMFFFRGKEAGNFSRFGSESTITEATEYNTNISGEAYSELRAIGDTGLFYADLRSGLQIVQPEVAQKLGLSKNKFLLTQFAAGVEFAGLLRFGFQRFAGPSSAFGVSSSELSKWHLVIQLVPKLPKK
jgi:hypothetical protein